MKRMLITAAIFLLPTTAVLASDNQQNDPYKSSGDPNYRYRSSTGTEYQYDLSKPNDQVRYEVDVKAKMRDELNVDPRREIDQGLGQHGGGARRR